MREEPEDFNYNGYWFYYRPHPQLYGRWEAVTGDDLEDENSKFAGRFLTKADCRLWAKDPVKYANLKYPR